MVRTYDGARLKEGYYLEESGKICRVEFDTDRWVYTPDGINYSTLTEKMADLLLGRITDTRAIGFLEKLFPSAQTSPSCTPQNPGAQIPYDPEEVRAHLAQTNREYAQRQNRVVDLGHVERDRKISQE